MAPRSTSFRISDQARRRLSERAEREGLSVTALLEQLIIEEGRQAAKRRQALLT